MYIFQHNKTWITAGMLFLVLLVFRYFSAMADAPRVVGGSAPSYAYLTSVAKERTLPPTVTPTPTLTPVPTPTPEPVTWFDTLAYYRDMAGLPQVGEYSTWSEGCRLHARYVVKNNLVTHYESSGNPWYTSQGATAGQVSNVLGDWQLGLTDRYAIESWLQTPFHAVGILDPQLVRTGFGSFSEDSGNIRYGAALDVIRGLGQLPRSVRFPIMWPGEGATVPLTMHTSGYPEALASCPGYTLPSGLPIIVQVGPGYSAVYVTGHSVKKNGLEVASCVFDAGTYSNPDSGQQSLARSILAARDAVVIIPKKPLKRGATYEVSLTANGHTYTWSFNVAENTSASEEVAANVGSAPSAVDDASPLRPARGMPH